MRLKHLGNANTRTALWAIIVVGLCAGAKDASAQEWRLDSNISQQVLYSDNLLLSRDREVSTVGFVTTPALHLERNTPAGQIAFDGRFDFAEYVDHSEFNSQDQFLDLAVDQSITERSTLLLDASFIHDTTLKSEQDVTGRFLNDSFEFINWSVAPGWAYLLSPVDEIEVRGSYKNVNYYTNEKTDYQYFGPSIDYSRQLDELSQFTATLSAFRFVPKESGNDYTDTISTLFGYAYDPSELFSISGGVGLSYSMRHEDPGNDTDELGYRLKFNVKYIMSDQTSLRASISHDTEPSGDGDQVVRNRVTFGIDHDITPLLTARFNADYVDNEDIFGTETNTSNEQQTTRYTSIRPALAYQLTEDWSLEAQYSFRYRLFEDENDHATSNSVFLTLQYNFPTWAGTGF
jgi:hypothetical protein